MRSIVLDKKVDNVCGICGSKEPFIETSSIYRFTNEDITSYFHHLQNQSYNQLLLFFHLPQNMHL